MSEVLWHGTSLLGMFVVFGVFWYILDRSKGVAWYRVWHKWTHREPLAEDVIQGFIFNRKTRVKLTAATIISTIQSIIAVVFGSDINLLAEFLLWIFEVPATMIGMGLGSLLFPLWSRKDKAFNLLDRFERGEVDVGDSVGKKVGAVIDTLEGHVDGVTDSIRDTVSEHTEKVLDGVSDILPGGSSQELDEDALSEVEASFENRKRAKKFAELAKDASAREVS